MIEKGKIIFCEVAIQKLFGFAAGIIKNRFCIVIAFFVITIEVPFLTDLAGKSRRKLKELL